MNEILILVICGEGALVMFLGGMIAKAIFKMADSVNDLTKQLSEFVKKDECKTDMGEHCSKMEELEGRIARYEKKFIELQTTVTMLHKDD
jgi:uncharacterized coiled-coil DUF342 family protein